jgi:hypothetical protein
MADPTNLNGVARLSCCMALVDNQKRGFHMAPVDKMQP